MCLLKQIIEKIIYITPQPIKKNIPEHNILTTDNFYKPNLSGMCSNLGLYDSWYPGHFRSLGHSVTRSLNHLIIGPFSQSYVCWSLGNDQQKYEWRKWPEW